MSYIDFFKKNIQNNRLSHLYLIEGSKGSGKLALAYEVAQLIIGKSDDHTKKQIEANEHQQVYLIEPDGLSIKKEQIIALQNEFSKTSLIMGARVYIIKDIEKMSQSAANSLLKFMEEPQSNQVYGLLLTTSKDQILDTIISRSQVIHIKDSMEEETIQSYVDNNIDIKYARIIAYLTKDLNEAKNLSENHEFIQMISFIEKIGHCLAKREVSVKLLMLENTGYITNDRDLFKYFLEVLMMYFSDVVHFKINQSLTFEYLKEDIKALSNMLNLNQVEEITNEIKKVIQNNTYYIQTDLALNDLLITLEKKG